MTEVDVEFKYEEINNNNCIISKMVAKMAATNLILMYLSSAFRYKDEWSVYSYKVKDVEFNYKEINKNNYIISKMVAINGGQDGRQKSDFSVSQLSL